MTVDNIAIYITILSAVSMILYLRVSKFFGSMMIFLTGFGILYKASADGWIGWIILASGFLMMIYALIENPKRRR